MRIVICGSMSSIRDMVAAKKKLLQRNHRVTLPKTLDGETDHESTKNKIEHGLIRGYFKEIESADAVLIVNVEKKGIPSYIGGNSFLEMAFAHVLNKKIFLLNDIPDMIYTDEIEAMQPVALNGDFSKIEN